MDFGVMRPSKEILGKIDGTVPALHTYEQVVFAEWVSSGEDLDGVNLIEVNRENGRPLKVWTYEGMDYEWVYDDEGSIAGNFPKSFKLSEVTQLSYQSLVYRHPLLKIDTEAEVQEIRTWGVDRSGRKRKRDEAARLVIIFDNFWDAKSEKPRPFQILEERGYEPRELSGGVSLGKKEQWVEKYRSFFFSNAMVMYVRNLEGRMVHSYSKISPIKYSGIDLPRGLELPIKVGKAEVIDF